MKQSIYSILVFFILNTAFSQTKEVILRKSFKVNSNTVLNLDFDNVSVVLEESLDGKIHFDYAIIFNFFSKSKRRIIKKKSKVKVVKRKNLIDLTVHNPMFLGENHKTDLKIDSFLVAMKDYNKFFIRKEQYKTKDSLVNEIKYSVGSDFDDFIKKNKNRYQRKGAFKKKKFYRQNFTIKVPKNVTIKLKALHSKITFEYDIINPFVAHTFKGVLKFKKILSKESEFYLMSGAFQTEKIEGGKYDLKDVGKVLIGSISNAKIATETSKIQIGEIGKGVSFNDFNSRMHIYNFSNDFSQFKYKGDYSKLFFYNVKNSNYSMNVYGHNTALNMKDIKTTFGISKEKELDKILEKKVKKNKISDGNIEIELINGILNIKE